MSIVTVAELKLFARIETDAHDTLLQTLLDGAESYAANECEIKFGSTEYEERLDGGSYALLPSARPITEVESITDAWDDDKDFDDEFWSDASGIYVEEDADWPEGRRRWRVAFTAGYESETLPDGLRVAVLTLAARAYDNSAGKASTGIEGYSSSWQELADASDVRAYLDRHSMRRIAD